MADNTAPANTAPLTPPTTTPVDPKAITPPGTPTPAAVEAKAVAQEIKRLKQLKLKVDGKEFTEDLPFEIEDRPEVVEYMKNQLQFSKMSQKRAAEASTSKKQLEEVANYLRAAGGDPKNARALLKELNIDEAKLMEHIIQEAEELAKKSPEQLEREKLESELKAAREEHEKIRKEAQDKELQFLTERSFQEYNETINEAIAQSTLPKGNPYVVGKIADYMLAGLKEGIKVDPKDIMPMIQEEIQDEFRQMVGLMGVEAAEKLIGKDILDKIRKKNLARAKPATPISKSMVDAAGKTKPKENDGSKKKGTFKDFFGT